jgi:hypothetical protein
MCGRKLRRGSFFAVLAIAVVLAFNSNSMAQDCTCKNIGGICIPDPVCVGKALQNAAPDANQSAEPRDGQKVLEKSFPRLTILATGYSQLPEMGKEEPGYGLYSYAALTGSSKRSADLLREIFESIPRIEDTAAQRMQLNIFYLPTRKDASAAFADSVGSMSPSELGRNFAGSFYDYRMARAILNHICNPPAEAIRELCQGDMSRGPYIFSYTMPGSTLEPVPPPFLFMDLSDVDPRAFGEIIAAFRAQVKREDISDGARINSLRLKILEIALKAGDFVGPVQKAIADIIHSVGPK